MADSNQGKEIPEIVAPTFFEFQFQAVRDLKVDNKWIVSIFGKTADGDPELLLLRELSTVEEDMASAAQVYLNDLGLLLKHIQFVDDILCRALRGTDGRIWNDVKQRRWLLCLVVKSFSGFADLIAVLKMHVTIPFKEEILQESADRIDNAFDLNGPLQFQGGIESLQDDLTGPQGLRHSIEIKKLAAHITLIPRRDVNVQDGRSADLPSTKAGSTALTPKLVCGDTIHDGGATNVGQTGTAVSMNARHSEDFRCANWFGIVYDFSVSQAGAIECLWKAWEEGLPYVSQSEICAAAGGDSTRVRDIFKGTGSSMHPAFDNMIKKKGNDLFFLEKPVR